MGRRLCRVLPIVDQFNSQRVLGNPTRDVFVSDKSIALSSIRATTKKRSHREKLILRRISCHVLERVERTQTARNVVDGSIRRSGS
jgi:hypothetical protein